MILQIKLGVGAEDDVAETLTLQAAHQSGTSQPKMSCDVDAAIFIHQPPRDRNCQSGLFSMRVETRRGFIAVLLHEKIALGQLQILGNHLGD